MTKQEIIQDETLFQRACGLWVERNIGQCVSSLMYDVGRNLEECSRIFDFDYDEAIGWFQREDYSEVVSDFIDDADIYDLNRVADMDGDWTDMLEELGIHLWDEDGNEVDPTSEQLDQIRTKVKSLITNDAEYTEIGRHFELEPDYNEVYEFWVLNDRWTAEELEAEGQVVFEFGGMTILGRMTTGQSILLDGVIRRIVKNLDDNHWIWSAVK